MVVNVRSFYYGGKSIIFTELQDCRVTITVMICYTLNILWVLAWRAVVVMGYHKVRTIHNSEQSIQSGKSVIVYKYEK